jgi:hypothetical protein
MKEVYIGCAKFKNPFEAVLSSTKNKRVHREKTHSRAAKSFSMNIFSG